MEQIYVFETIEELQHWIENQEAEGLRLQLLEEYERLLPYQNIQEWNQLVRLCEALRLVGWGNCEPQEAIASKWINGSFDTWLQNQYFEKQIGTTKSWRKQKDSFVIDAADADLTPYASTKLASQRNKLPKASIRFTRSGNYQKSLQPLVDQLDTLKNLLIAETRPAEYGTAFSYIGLTLSFSNHNDDFDTVRTELYHDQQDVPEELLVHQAGMPRYFIRPRLKISNLSTKQNELRLLVSRHFTKAFGYLPVEEQKAILLEDLLEIIDVLAVKLKKKKIAYRTDLLQEDLVRIFERWT